MLFREGYQHLSNVERKRIVTPDNVVLRLNRGERPDPLPVPVQADIDAVLNNQLICTQQYPSYQPFYEQLSKFVGFPKEQIVVGAGIEEFIRTLMFLCCAPGDKAAVLWPTCAMYDIYAQAFGVDLIRIKPKPGARFRAADILDALARPSVRDFVKVLFLPNPGQPVETHFLAYQIEFIAAWCHERDIVLAVDEAHLGFGAQTALHLVRKFDNIIVMRTFSKFFGAASIRVGYVVGQERVIKPLDAARPSGEIAGPSMAIASVLLDNYALLAEEAEQIAATRDWLRQELIKMGFRAWGKYGFSILVEFPTVLKMKWVVDALAQKGVYVKGSFPEPVDRCILLACGKRPIMEAFLKAFKDVI